MLGRTAIYSWWGESQGVWAMEFQRMFFLNFDWEMMTYWTIVGLSHALRYHYEAQDRALRASRLETRLMEAQLQTLQRQLQPHFLFNTLNTIAALMHRDVEAADAMLARLGDLLRLSFETLGVQEVALEQELDFLRQYVAIEQARFRERLTVSFDIGARRARVPGAKPFAAAARRKRHPARDRAAGRARARAGAGGAQRLGARARGPRRRRRRAAGAVARPGAGRRAVEHPVAAGRISTATSTASRCGSRPAAGCRW